ncbi:hypothetical protein NBRC116602_25060 [Hyphomicrobiales bacterium 4NK60-0047b]
MLVYPRTQKRKNGGALSVVEISSPDELEEWLEDKPIEWAQVLAYRSSLRVISVLGAAIISKSVQDEFKIQLILSFLRTSIISEVAITWQTAEIRDAALVTSVNARIAAMSAVALAAKAPTAYISAVALAAEALTASSAAIATDYTETARSSAVRVVDSINTAHVALAGNTTPSPTYFALNRDLHWLLFHENKRYVPQNLILSPLWEGQRNPTIAYWHNLKTYLRSNNAKWQFWIDWYQSKLDGTLHSGRKKSEQTDLYHQIATFPKKYWEEGSNWIEKAEAVNHRIAELLEEIKEGRVGEALGTPILEEEVNEPIDLKIEPQNKDALRFKTNEDGKIQLTPASEYDKVLTDEGAKARHEETLYSGEELIRLFDPNKSGANAVAPLIEKTQRCLDALGKTPQEVDIDRLIPRGEALRQIANREENRDDFTDVPPLPDGFKEALNNFLAAYNPYIALDPVLEKRDQIRLGPDEKGQLITTVEGQVIIDALTEANLLEEDTKDILDEVTNTAEGSDAPESRANRYYSESLRNLGRNILAEVDKAYRSIMKTGKIASEVCFDGAVVGAVMIHQDFARKRAQIILKHEKWFVKSFGRSPGMKKIIVGYIHRIKTNPLLTDDDI